MIIYYAHSMLIYNKEQEKAELKLIKDHFKDATVINPNGWIYDNGKGADIMKQCFQFVNNSDAIVFSSLEDGVIGKGVYDELKQAKSRGKIVYYIIDNKIVPYTSHDFNNIRMMDEGKNWKRYAIVTVDIDNKLVLDKDETVVWTLKDAQKDYIGKRPKKKNCNRCVFDGIEYGKNTCRVTHKLNILGIKARKCKYYTPDKEVY